MFGVSGQLSSLSRIFNNQSNCTKVSRIEIEPMRHPSSEWHEVTGNGRITSGIKAKKPTITGFDLNFSTTNVNCDTTQAITMAQHKMRHAAITLKNRLGNIYYQNTFST